MKSSKTIIRLLFVCFALILLHLAVTLRWSKESKIIRRATLISDSPLVKIELAKTNEAAVVITNAVEWKLVEPIKAGVDKSRMNAITDALQVWQFDDILETTELNKLGRTEEDFGLTNPRLKVKAVFDNEVKNINFGEDTSTHDGVYANIEGEEYVLVVPRLSYEALAVSADDVRRRQLFETTSEEVLSVDIRDGNGNFEQFDRQGIKNENFSKYLNNLLTAEAQDFVWSASLAEDSATASASLLSSYGLESENSTLVVLHGVDGHDTSISFGKPAGEGKVYALVFGGTSIVTVNENLKAKVDKVEELVDRRLFPVDEREITSIGLTLDGVKYLLSKSETGWRLDAPIVAPANSVLVEKIKSRILALNEDALADEGIMVTIPGGKAPCVVVKNLVLGGEAIENLRSSEIVNLVPADVKRITLGDASIIFNAERRQWMIEESAKNGVLNEEAVLRLIATLDPLNAIKVERLKVTDGDLAEFGLLQPAFKIAIDLVDANAARKNILIGNETANGYYATLGSNDAIFIISQEQMQVMTAPIIE